MDDVLRRLVSRANAIGHLSEEITFPDRSPVDNALAQVAKLNAKERREFLERYVGYRVERTDRCWRVVNPEGVEYMVSLDGKVCSCPDHFYRGTTCKHMQEVARANR
jgi:predicted nucleic acid-binding Zn finger protein